MFLTAHNFYCKSNSQQISVMEVPLPHGLEGKTISAAWCCSGTD